MGKMVEPQVLLLSYGSPLIPDIQLHQINMANFVTINKWIIIKKDLTDEFTF